MKPLEPGDLAVVLGGDGSMRICREDPAGETVEVRSVAKPYPLSVTPAGLANLGHDVVTRDGRNYWVTRGLLKKIGDENPNQAIPLAECLFKPKPRVTSK
jgi:hypothetical protein